MKLIDAIQQLRALDIPVFLTGDAAATLKTTPATASQTLRRLQMSGHIVRLKRGLWAFSDRVEPLRLPEYLVAPLPAYVSLYTALYHHDMIDQVPSVIFAVSPSRAQIFQTALGTVSIHKVDPVFFDGFDFDEATGVKMATPEKALADILFLTATRSRLFARLPELHLPDSFDKKQVVRWIKAIPGPVHKRAAIKHFGALAIP